MNDPKNGIPTPRIQIDAAPAALSTNNCAAILSTNFLLHDPIILYNDQAYWADFQYTEDLDFALIDAGLVANTSFYNSCAPSTLSNGFKLHMPEVNWNGVSYIADFQYSGGVTFSLTAVETN
ncbi:MAG: hypothetical protein ABR903_01270 [Thermodesulfovibrionales bacterium]